LPDNDQAIARRFNGVEDIADVGVQVSHRGRRLALVLAMPMAAAKIGGRPPRKTSPTAITPLSSVRSSWLITGQEAGLGDRRLPGAGQGLATGGLVAVEPADQMAPQASFESLAREAWDNPRSHRFPLASRQLLAFTTASAKQTVVLNIAKSEIPKCATLSTTTSSHWYQFP
jgi:hypothetical protein